MSWWEFRGFWGILQRSHASSLLAEKELMIEQLKSRVEMQQEMLDLLKKNS